MRRQVRQGESAGSAIRRCGATLSPEAWGVKGIRHFCFRVKAEAPDSASRPGGGGRFPRRTPSAHPTTCVIGTSTLVQTCQKWDDGAASIGQHRQGKEET